MASACSRPRPTPSRTATPRGPGNSTQLDNLVDDLNRTVVEQVLEIGGDRMRREWGLRMVLVARALERIADNAVDIAEQASYVVTGELREFSDASHPDEPSGEAA